MANDVKDLVEEAKNQGWRVQQSKKGHWKCYAPDGENIVNVPGTPSDPRSLLNAIAKMRQFGFRWKGH